MLAIVGLTCHTQILSHDFKWSGIAVRMDLFISCPFSYIFSTGQMVKASTLNFSVAPLGERVSEVRRQLFFTLHVNTLHLTIFPP